MTNLIDQSCEGVPLSYVQEMSAQQSTNQLGLFIIYCFIIIYLESETQCKVLEHLTKIRCCCTFHLIYLTYFTGSNILPINLRGPIYMCAFYGAQMWFDERVQKISKGMDLKFSLCCAEGKVWLQPFKETPEPLNFLLDYNGGGKAKQFGDNIVGTETH